MLPGAGRPHHCGTTATTGAKARRCSRLSPANTSHHTTPQPSSTSAKFQMHTPNFPRVSVFSPLGLESVGVMCTCCLCTVLCITCVLFCITLFNSYKKEELPANRVLFQTHSSNQGLEKGTVKYSSLPGPATVLVLREDTGSVPANSTPAVASALHTSWPSKSRNAGANAAPSSNASCGECGNSPIGSAGYFRWA